MEVAFALSLWISHSFTVPSADALASTVAEVLEDRSHLQTLFHIQKREKKEKKKKTHILDVWPLKVVSAAPLAVLQTLMVVSLDPDASRSPSFPRNSTHFTFSAWPSRTFLHALGITKDE